MTREERQDLLEAVIRACGSGAAEAEPAGEELHRRFYPVPGDLRVLDPEARIVVGPKGAGKSQLFRALADPHLRQVLVTLARERQRATPAFERTNWIPGFTIEGQAFPPPALIEAAVRELGQDFRDAWLGLMAQSLWREDLLAASRLPDELTDALRNATYDVVGVARAARRPELTAPLYAALDTLDRNLVENDRWIVLSYDELDAISPSDWTIVDSAVRALAQSWSVHARRFRRIQPKIFVRQDIFDRAATGPDIAKLALGGVSLEWSVGAMYAMLFKRLLSEPELAVYLRPARLTTSSDGVLGQVPIGHDEQDFARVVERLVGRYMGPDFRKGLTLRWIPNHLKDGNGRCFPDQPSTCYDRPRASNATILAQRARDCSTTPAFGERWIMSLSSASMSCGPSSHGSEL